MQNRKSIESEPLERRLFMSTYMVNTLSDAIAPITGQLTLRQAVGEANAHAGADTIAFDPKVFTAGKPHSILLLNGQIAFTGATGATTVNGPGSAVIAVDGNKTSRVFQISSGVTVSISGLTITNGEVNSSAGVAATGAGIQNAGVLTLSSVTVSNNSASGGSDQSWPGVVGGAAYGAGIHSTGALSLINSSVSGNHAFGGSSEYNYDGNSSGGGIYSTGSLTITGSSILGNSATGGGGGGNFSIGDQGTAGDALGGGIFSSGQTVLNSSSVASNLAIGGTDEFGGAGDGGAIYLAGAATFSGDTINGNQANGGYDPSAEGGSSGNAWGGAVYSNAMLSITSSTLSGNTAMGGPGTLEDYGPAGNAYGGAIAALGGLTISSSTVLANLAEGGRPGGGLNNPPYLGAEASGGGIYAAQQLIVTNCTVTLNTARGAYGGYVDADGGGPGQGGGIATLGTGTISDSTITDNVAKGGVGTTAFGFRPSSPYISGDGEGGGVYNSGALIVVDSTVSGNQATGGVGAVPGNTYAENGYAGTGGDGLGAGIFSSSTLTVGNTTITANVASGGNGGDSNEGSNSFSGGNGGNGEGGAIYCSPALTLSNSTIVQNTANGGAGGAAFTENGDFGQTNGTPGVAEGGGIYAGKNSVLDNSILSANTAASGADIYSSLSPSSGYNLIGYGGGLTNGVNGNKIGIHNPLLSPLGNFGGPTQTMVPLPGSPTIGGGNKSLIPPGVTTDQRGYPLITGNSLDIGAVQFGNASITGKVFNDEFTTGKLQLGDPGLAGWTVYLDLNHDGRFDSGDVSAITSSSGSCSFIDVPAGTYAVSIVSQNNYRRTTPAVLPVYVTVSSGATIAGPTFGETQDALISGSVINSKTLKPLANFRVYLDLNNDGKWETTEPSVVTASNGTWSFNIATPGSYRVRIVARSGYKTAAPAGGVFTFNLGKASARIGNVFAETAIV